MKGLGSGLGKPLSLGMGQLWGTNRVRKGRPSKDCAKQLPWRWESILSVQEIGAEWGCGGATSRDQAAFYVLSSFPQCLKKISAQENQEVPRGILNTGWMFLGIGEGWQCLESNRNNAPMLLELWQSLRPLMASLYNSAADCWIIQGVACVLSTELGTSNTRWFVNDHRIDLLEE